MTNKEIIEKVAQESRVVVYGAFSNELTRIIDLARADEREKLQGVDVWVSIDKGYCFYETHEIWHGSPPTLDRKGYYQGEHGSNITERLATVLGISKGKCAKFRIVRVE